jgi:neutral ceramidase
MDLDAMAELQEALGAVAASAARSQHTLSPGRLEAGWAKSTLEMPVGTPLAGYGHREGRPATGTHDDITVRALVLSDGRDTVAVVASDLLIAPENVAEPARMKIAERLGIKASNILLNASHTHSGPGAFAPGWVAGKFAGEYDPEVARRLIDSIVETVIRAHEQRRPARLGTGQIAAAEHVKNRTRLGVAVDPSLQYMVVEKDDQSRAVAVSFGAHATILGPDNMKWSAGYPGYLVRALEREGADMALFLAGAVGSAGPVAPGEGYAAAEAMGEALAAKILPELRGTVLEEHLDVTSAGVPVTMPPLQVRINRRLRLSPLFVRSLGINNGAWIGGVRVGRTLLVGTPNDFSGEMSPALKDWAAESGLDLWVLSFNGDYVGYASPDRYYTTAVREGKEGYEMYDMSWCGPQQGEFLVRLIRRTVEELTRDAQPLSLWTGQS